MLTLILIIILILLLVGAFPHAPWYGTQGRTWGYFPMGGIALILIIVLILILSGTLPPLRY